jgi:hypothetical protein
MSFRDIWEIETCDTLILGFPFGSLKKNKYLNGILVGRYKVNIGKKMTILPKSKWI